MVYYGARDHCATGLHLPTMRTNHHYAGYTKKQDIHSAPKAIEIDLIYKYTIYVIKKYCVITHSLTVQTFSQHIQTNLITFGSSQYTADLLGELHDKCHIQGREMLTLPKHLASVIAWSGGIGGDFSPSIVVYVSCLLCGSN